MALKRRKKEEPKVRAARTKCWMCQHFQDAEKSDGGRLCVKKRRKPVRVIDKGRTCDKFSLTKSFACNKRKQMTDVELCLSVRHRRKEGDENAKKLYKGCSKKCKQGRLLDPFMDAAGRRSVTKEEKTDLVVDVNKKMTWGQIKSAIDKKVPDDIPISSIELHHCFAFLGLKFKVDPGFLAHGYNIHDDYEKIPSKFPDFIEVNGHSQALPPTITGRMEEKSKKRKTKLIRRGGK